MTDEKPTPVPRPQQRPGPASRRWVVFPPETIVVENFTAQNPLLACAQDGQISISQLGGYLAAWACQAKEGSKLTIQCLSLTDDQATVIAEADNPPIEIVRSTAQALLESLDDDTRAALAAELGKGS